MDEYMLRSPRAVDGPPFALQFREQVGTPDRAIMHRIGAGSGATLTWRNQHVRRGRNRG